MKLLHGDQQAESTYPVVMVQRSGSHLCVVDQTRKTLPTVEVNIELPSGDHLMRAHGGPTRFNRVLCLVSTCQTITSASTREAVAKHTPSVSHCNEVIGR